MSWARGAATAATLLATTALPGIAAAEGPPLPRNLYGNTGGIDLPSASMQPDGEIGFSINVVGDVSRGGVTFQALPGVEGTFRYSTYSGLPANGQSDLYDRSFDLKFRLLEEGPMNPAVAIGFRDVLGTGISASEYVVGTKSLTPNIRATAGVGWGRLGSFGGFSSPFGDADDRTTRFDTDGDVRFSDLFSGDAALFAGLEWDTPLKGLTLKAEYSSDAYLPERAAGLVERNSPFNFGAEYSPAPGVSLGGYYLHGSELGLKLTFSANPMRPGKLDEAEPAPFPLGRRTSEWKSLPKEEREAWVTDPEANDFVLDRLRKGAEGEDLTVEAVRLGASRSEVRFVNNRYTTDAQALGRMARIMTRAMPATVEVFDLTLVKSGVPTTTLTLSRQDLENRADVPGGNLDFVVDGVTDAAPGSGAVTEPGRYPDFIWAIEPALSFSVVNTSEPARIDARLRARGDLRLAPGLTLQSTVSQNIFNSFDEATRSSAPSLPGVRSDIIKFRQESDANIDSLTAEYMSKLSPSVYGRVTAGYLELMYAGVSGEVLWKPATSRIGLGAELNYVEARETDGLLGLRDLDGLANVNGHVSLYWDTGYRGIEAQLDVGRYLAGDVGATVNLTRRFNNGWEVGGFFTLTDVSADDFGSGSFDKGIHVTVPLSWGRTQQSRSSITAEFGSAFNDGGARLRVPRRLYPLIRDVSQARLGETSGRFWK